MLNTTRKSRIKRRFSRAGPSYDAASWHQDCAAETLCRSISADPCPGSILEWGCGTGLLTRRLLGRWPESTLIALDLAPGMLVEARRRTGDNRHLHLVEADAEEYLPPSPVDLLISNCAVQWFSQRETLGLLAAERVAQGGRIALSIPLQGTLIELWRAFEDVQRVPDAALPLWTPDACGQAFEVPHWTDVRIGIETFVSRLRGAREVLLALGRIGATARWRNADAPPLSPAVLRRIMQAYDARYRGTDARVPCTYRIAFVQARRTNR